MDFIIELFYNNIIKTRGQGAEMTSLTERARFFAIRVHRGQIRLNKAPFMVHPDEVAQLVRESDGSDEEIAAAYLHDSVEDTPTTLTGIVKNFGVSVGAIVDGMTDPPEFSTLSIPIRKRRQAERICSKSDSVKRVKIADQTSNVRSIIDPISWSRQKCLDYIEGARLIVLECRGVSKFLEVQFDEAYQAAIEAHK